MFVIGRHRPCSPDGDGPATGGPVTPPPPAPSPLAPPAAPSAPPPSAQPNVEAERALAAIRQRKAERQRARDSRQAPGQPQLPKDVQDKLARYEAYETAEKARQESIAKTLKPEARAVFDSIPDLQGRSAFLAFAAAKPAAATPPPAANGGAPPASAQVDVPALIAERGREWVEANHPEAFQKYADGFRVAGKKTSLKAFLPKKT